jgi:hypothetical protein
VVEAGVCVDVEVLRVGGGPERDRPWWSARRGRRRRPLGWRGSTAMARTHVEEFGRVVGEMHGTGAELVEVEARAEPRRAITYGRWRRRSTLRAD